MLDVHVAFEQDVDGAKVGEGEKNPMTKQCQSHSHSKFSQRSLETRSWSYLIHY